MSGGRLRCRLQIKLKMNTSIKSIARAALSKTAALSKAAVRRYTTVPTGAQQQVQPPAPKAPIYSVIPMENDETPNSLLRAGREAERISAANDVTNEIGYNEQKGDSKNIGTGLHQQRYREDMANANKLRAQEATAEHYPFAYTPASAKNTEAYARSGHTPEAAAKIYYERLVNEAYANDTKKRDRALQYNLNVDGNVGKSLWKSLWSRDQIPEFDDLWVKAYGMAAKNRMQAHKAKNDYNSLQGAVQTYGNPAGFVEPTGQAAVGAFDGSNMTYSELKARAAARADATARALGLQPGSEDAAYLKDAMVRYLTNKNTYMRTRGDGKDLTELLTQYGRNNGWGDTATKATIQRIQDDATRNIYNNNNNAYNMMMNNLLWHSRY